MKSESKTAGLYQTVVLCFVFPLMCLVLMSCGSGDNENSNNELFLSNAEELRSVGQFRASIIESKNAIQANPGDSRGYILMAKIFVEIGQPKDAIKTLEAIEDESAEYILTLAEAYVSIGKTRSAAELLERSQDRLADHTLALNLQLGNLALAQRQFETAKARYADVLAEDQTNVIARLGLVSIAGQQNNLDEAEILLAKILETHPSNPTALLISSSLHTRDGDLGLAEISLMDAISGMQSSDVLTPTRFSILAALRDNLTQQGRTSEALVYAGLINDSMPGAEALNDQWRDAMRAMSESNFVSARESLAQILSESPGSEQAGTMLGVLEYLEGNNDAAVKQFEQFIDPETATPMALQVFALAELKLNRADEVLTLLEHEIDSSQDSKLVAIYGIAAVSANDIDTGERYLLKSAELDKDNGRLRLPLVRLYNSIEKFDEALEQIELAFESQPNDALIQAGYVQQLITTGDIEKAGKVVRGIRSSFPNSAETQILAARYHLYQKNYDEAMKILQRVLSMEETTQVRHLLAALNLEMENYTNAEMQYRAVIRLDAEDGLAYKGLITAFERQSKQEEGIAAVMQLKEQTGAVQPVLVLSEFYGRNGDFVQAFSLLEELEEPRSVQTTRLLQSLYLAKANRQLIDKNFDQGRKTILEGLTSDPDDPRLLGLLINIELLTEQFGEAAKLLAQLEKIIPDTPIVAVLSGDLAIANENFALAYKQYLLAWEVTTTDQVALKIFRSLSKHAVDKVKLIAFFEEWAEKVPDQRVSELTKAGYYLQEGEMDSAKIPYEALIEKFDDLYLAHNNLAWVYGEKELKKALASGKRAYELAPENPEVIDTYAWFLYKNSDLEQAKELLVKAVDLAPDHEEIAQHLDEVLSKI